MANSFIGRGPPPRGTPEYRKWQRENGRSVDYRPVYVYQRIPVVCKLNTVYGEDFARDCAIQLNQLMPKRKFGVELVDTHWFGPDDYRVVELTSKKRMRKK